jgi:hypothetical protein
LRIGKERALEELISKGFGNEINKILDEYLIYEKRLMEGFERIKDSKISSLKIQLLAEQDILNAMTKVNGEYSRAAIEAQKARVQGIKDEMAGVTKASIDAAQERKALIDEQLLKEQEAAKQREALIEAEVLKEIEAAERKRELEDEQLQQKILNRNKQMQLEKQFSEDLAGWEEKIYLQSLTGERKVWEEKQALRQAEYDEAIASINSRYEGEVEMLDKLYAAVDEFYAKKWALEDEALMKSKAGWKQWGDWLIDFFSSIHGGIKGTYESLKTGFTDIFSAFKGKETIEMGPPAPWETLKGEEGDVSFLSKIGAALGPIGKVASVIMQIPQIVKQVWASIKDFAKSIASLFGCIVYFIKNINTHLFLLINNNNLLQQRSYAEGIGARASFVPIRMGRSQLDMLFSSCTLQFIRISTCD